MKKKLFYNGSVRTATGCLMALAALAMATPSLASTSGTAANTIIRNTVTVKYKDTANNQMPDVIQSVDIKVDLVAATPTLNAPIDQTVDSGTAAVFNYSIFSNANGPDNYAITTPTITESAGITNGTSIVGLSSVSIALGATTIVTPVTIAAAGNTAITVPSDLASDALVNGIASGVVVVIDGQQYNVFSIVDNGGTVGATSTITVTGNGTASALLPAGTVIGERKTFTLTVTNGTVTASANQSVTVTTSAKPGNAAAATDDTITSIRVASLTVVKEVSTDGTNFFGSTPLVAIAPGTVLYYRIKVTNSGSSNANNAIVTDTLPPYTTYQTGAKRANGADTTYTLAPTPLTDGSDGDGFDYNVTTANVATYSIGTIAPGATVQLFLKYKIN